VLGVWRPGEPRGGRAGGVLRGDAKSRPEVQSGGEGGRALADVARWSWGSGNARVDDSDAYELVALGRCQFGAEREVD